MIRDILSSMLASCAVGLAGLLLASGVAAAEEAPGRAAAATGITPADFEGIELGLPITGGTGCPDGTVSAVLSPDYTKLSILYDAYVAETTGEQSTARRSCNVAVPMYIPPGLSVSVFRTDYRGYAYIPEDGRGSFRAEYFFAGSRGPTVRRRFGGGFDQDFLMRDEMPLEVWSRCGDEIIARINSSIMAHRPVHSDEQAFLAIDSMDISSEMDFYLHWRHC